MLKKTAPLVLLLLVAAHTSSVAQSDLSSPTRAAAQRHPIVYANAHFGFRFLLPRTWIGYTVLADGAWNGMPVVNGEAQSSPTQLVQGPLLRIRNPRWSKANPYEDIPIMIFTHAQWVMVEGETLVTSAAPFPPSELARNARYVFALPPRYNFDYATGWQEVEAIIASKPLRPMP